ncbi:hypothetical protein [Streptomyces sp. NPDC056255]|uniref:hypothetical protein n=1 Tax=Streptomyces sp. NPDC056255 TaxID=3345764 RepID=UPI0035DAE0A6
MAADPDRPRLTGPAGARLTTLAQHTVFDGQVVTDEARLRRIMARHDPHLYPGRFLTCVYNPDRALCRTPAAAADTPAMAECQPLACRNTALTPTNHQALTEHLAELTAALAGGDRLAPLPTPPAHRAARHDRSLPHPTRPGARPVKRPLPDTDAVKAAIDTVLEQAAARGRRPTVTAVERHLGIPHATFHRHYRDLIDQRFRPRLPAPPAPTRRSPVRRRPVRRTCCACARRTATCGAPSPSMRKPFASVVPLPIGTRPSADT